jgi:hypothetical protein
MKYAGSNHLPNLERRDAIHYCPEFGATLTKYYMCTYQNRQHMTKILLVRTLFSNDFRLLGSSRQENGVQSAEVFSKVARGFNAQRNFRMLLVIHSFPRNTFNSVRLPYFGAR